MALDALLIAAKALLYASTLLVAGLVVHHRSGIVRTVPLVATLGTLILIAVSLRFILMMMQLSGGLGEPIDWAMAPIIWEVNRAQILAFLLGAGSLILGRFVAHRVLPPVGAVVLIVGFGLGGHTVAVDDPLLPVVVMVHVGLAAFWFAAPMTLFPRESAPTPELLVKLERFSQLAIWVVPLALALGTGLLLRLAGGLEATFATNYGQLLLVKLAFALVALTIGAYNKKVATARLRSEPEIGSRLLQRTLTAEAVLFVFILVSVAVATTILGPER